MRRWLQIRRVVLACALAAQTTGAHANPEGGSVSAGSATIESAGNVVHIRQHTDRAVIDWRSFDIASGERTEFEQPSSSAIALNRVQSSSASRIDGALKANGNVVIINQNGVVFGRGATVDTNSLVVTTANTDNDRFMQGEKLVLDEPGAPDAAIVNEGTITAAEAGLVGLVAPQVENRGVITARLGRAHLAAGDTATVDLYGDGLLEVAVSDHVRDQLVRNSGTIAADGGVVALTAAAGKSLINTTMQIGGHLRAQTVSNHQGAIVIASKSQATTTVTAALDASGKQRGTKGGAVHVLSDRVALKSGAAIDVSGDAGGGEILIGGDYQGGVYRGLLNTPADAFAWGNTPGGYSAVNGSTIAGRLLDYVGTVPANASRLFADKEVTLSARATDSGNGGRIILWSQDGTVFRGHADVSANAASGNGGFIEVSGKQWLEFAGGVNARGGALGEAGMLLLDPADITISSAADSAISASTPFQSTGAASSNLNVTTLQNALNGAANITISSAAGSGGAGDITFTDAVSWNSVRSLTVNASNNITVNNTITNASTGSITLNANVAATGDIAINNNISTGGSITMLANRDITQAPGVTLTTGAAGGLSLRAANASVTGTGNLTLDGNLSVGTGALTLLSGVNGTRPSYTAAAGNLSPQSSFGAVSIRGFEDLTIDRNITSSGNITLLAMRDLTLNAARTLTTGAAGTLDLRAANGVNSGTGNLTLDGNISMGSGTVTMVSGVNGTRPSWTMDATSFGVQGASVGGVSIDGFQDLTVDRSLTSTADITLVAQRDLTLNAGRTLTNGATNAMRLQAAGGSASGTGNLYLDGSLSVGTGTFSLISGNNGGRPSYTAAAGNLSRQGATFGAINWQGFNDLTIDRTLNSSSTISFSNNTRTILSDDLTSTSTMTFSNATTIGEGVSVALTTSNANATFSSTVNGTAGGSAENLSVNTGTGTATFSGIIGGTAPLGDLTVNADNLTLSANANGTGTITLRPNTAARAVNIGTSAADNSTAAGFNLSNTEAGRIANGWASVVIGSLTTGDVTNSRVSWVDPITFLSGNDFINAVAISATDTLLARAVRDVVLDQDIVTTNTGASAITLVAGRNVTNNRGATALTVGSGGRWLIYSTNPTDTTGEETLSNAFNRYTCAYGGACPALGSGNGLLYSYTPTATATVSSSTYRYGDAVIAPGAYTLTATGYLNALDSAADSITGAVLQTNYTQGSNAGTAYTITDNGSSLVSSVGYGLSYSSTAGTVGTRLITLRANNQTQTYGAGTSLGTTGYTVSSGSLHGTDAISGITLATDATTSGAGEFDYRSTPWALTPSAAIFSSGLSSNYGITYANATTGLTINRRALTITATGVNRRYNGRTSASATYADDRLSGDVFTVTGTANFTDKLAGVGKTVNITGISAGAPDGDNYSYTTTATTTADILPGAAADELPSSVPYMSQRSVTVPHWGYMLRYRRPRDYSI